MKKLLISLVLLISCINITAQTYWYQANKFASANITNGFYNWSKWQDSNVLIKMDLDDEVITIYSPTVQVYRLLGIDESNSKNTINFRMIDQDNDRGHIRLRYTDDESFIYVDFQNVSWVYCVTKIDR